MSSKKDKDKKAEVRNPDYAHAFVFVFNLSEPATETTTMAYYEAFQAAEASENQSVKASDSNK